MLQKITPAHSHPLFNVAATRRIEKRVASTLEPHALMVRAGSAVARLALALAPHARCIWVACGPGNNGGDGFEAAAQLQLRGKRVVVTWTGAGESGMPADAQSAHSKAIAAGVTFASHPPPDFDFCVDALLGIGASLDPARQHTERITEWLQVMASSTAPVVAVDVPSGLNADTGAVFAINSGAACTRIMGSRRLFTLCLLTLKPGLFTFEGRDHVGEVWFDDLGIEPDIKEQATAWLQGADRCTLSARHLASHSSHKGSFGDVAVLGGASTAASHMTGAALLAARAALFAGAGRVFVSLLGDNPLSVDASQPELMFRVLKELDLQKQVVVCGCGGGAQIAAVLPQVLTHATCLVLDADALNTIAGDASLQNLLQARAARGFVTVLTPHPLEAARLLQSDTALVQSDRLKAAGQLAAKYQAVIVLKGSGTVIAAFGQTSCINSTGNALLATAGTGDVLAGMVGAYLASGLNAFDAACSAVFIHGRSADVWAKNHPGQALTASLLAGAI